MIEIDITEEMLSRAKARAEGALFNFKTPLYKFSNLVHGFVGEEAVRKVLGVKPIGGNKQGIDFILDGLKYEVKSRTIKKPIILPTYSVSVRHKSIYADYYIFVFVLKDLSKAIVVGSMEVKEFNKIAKWKPRGYDGFEVLINQVEEWNLTE